MKQFLSEGRVLWPSDVYKEPMKTKTIKLNEGEYHSFDSELEDHDVVILTGARGAGKSYPTAKAISKMLERDLDAKFIYMRIDDAELSTFMTWCEDLDLAALSGGASYRLARGKPTKGDIALIGYDETGMIISSRIIGKCVSLESSHIFKSGKYNDFCAIVFEEYAHLKMNAENEKRYVFNFLENVISIFRDRPKKIFLLCNSLRSIPLLDQAIDRLTGQIFKNPLKIKIFRKSTPGTEVDAFMAYLNGELYTPDAFTVNIDEFRVAYVNANFIMRQNFIYPRKFYIQRNKENMTKHYREMDYINLQRFCQLSTVNEFYYQTKSVEREFVTNYEQFLKEIAAFIAKNGSRFLL